MKKPFLIVLTFFCFAKLAFSCTFVPASFCQTAQIYEGTDQDFIIANGYISSIDDDGINLEIISIIKGVENRNNIRIWDGTDFDCNGPFSMAASDFGSINDTLILILPKIDSIENIWDEIGDYRRPDNYTNTPVLYVKDDLVNGFIKGDWTAPPENRIHTFPYSAFVNSWLIDNDCLKILSLKETEKMIHCVLYPNPALRYFYVNSDNLKQNFDLKIVNLHGKALLIKNKVKTDSKIYLDGLSSGLYYVIVEEQGRMVSMERLVKF